MNSSLCCTFWQIRILTKLDDDEEVPAFDDVFREDEVSNPVLCLFFYQ